MFCELFILLYALLETHSFNSFNGFSIRFHAGNCEDFATFVAAAHESLASETYKTAECDFNEHSARCNLTCATGFELSNENALGTFICDPNENPHPGWRHEDNSAVPAVCNQSAFESVCEHVMYAYCFTFQWRIHEAFRGRMDIHNNLDTGISRSKIHVIIFEF